ncbi:MAG: hypothetical protein P4M11_03865 [Candidatus Pacebacteria bacterium]|nr:hypothetical protein [Candidatus Paceibacterota bacterium]
MFLHIQESSNFTIRSYHVFSFLSIPSASTSSELSFILPNSTRIMIPFVLVLRYVQPLSGFLVVLNKENEVV